MLLLILIPLFVEAKRMADEEGVSKTKERIEDGVKAAKAKLTQVESRL